MHAEDKTRKSSILGGLIKYSESTGTGQIIPHQTPAPINPDETRANYREGILEVRAQKQRLERTQATGRRRIVIE